ncbi:MAG TPA: hypothetical protein VNA15_03715 [Candidatus Angelobacter sp.]|nr:hypothetical protein [Candidatus Angelobacter sp.]
MCELDLMSLSTVPIALASSSYTWSIACSGQGNSTASWYWYQGGLTGTPLTTGQINCNGTR